MKTKLITLLVLLSSNLMAIEPSTGESDLSERERLELQLEIRCARMGVAHRNYIESLLRVYEVNVRNQGEEYARGELSAEILTNNETPSGVLMYESSPRDIHRQIIRSRDIEATMIDLGQEYIDNLENGCHRNEQTYYQMISGYLGQ